MQIKFFVAFYAYAKEVDGKIAPVLDTRVIVDKDTVCSGLYSVDSGECMGLGSGGVGANPQAVVQPPQPLPVPGFPLEKWPMPGD